MIDDEHKTILTIHYFHDIIPNITYKYKSDKYMYDAYRFAKKVKFLTREDRRDPGYDLARKVRVLKWPDDRNDPAYSTAERVQVLDNHYDNGYEFAEKLRPLTRNDSGYNLAPKVVII